jgi:hypothetical protein
MEKQLVFCMIVYLDILQICLKQVEASWVGDHKVKILID